jgi:hypothetical protein
MWDILKRADWKKRRYERDKFSDILFFSGREMIHG